MTVGNTSFCLLRAKLRVRDSVDTAALIFLWVEESRPSAVECDERSTDEIEDEEGGRLGVNGCRMALGAGVDDELESMIVDAESVKFNREMIDATGQVTSSCVFTILRSVQTERQNPAQKSLSRVLSLCLSVTMVLWQP